jgi:hypothetical protein
MGQRMDGCEHLPTNPEAICGLDAVGELFMVVVLTLSAYIIKSTDSGDNWHYIDMSLMQVLW